MYCSTCVQPPLLTERDEQASRKVFRGRRFIRTFFFACLSLKCEFANNHFWHAFIMNIVGSLKNYIKLKDVLFLNSCNPVSSIIFIKLIKIRHSNTESPDNRMADFPHNLFPKYLWIINSARESAEANSKSLIFKYCIKIYTKIWNPWVNFCSLMVWMGALNILLYFYNNFWIFILLYFTYSFRSI